MSMKEKLEFFVQTAMGMESLLARELVELGIQAGKETRAGVPFVGTLEQAYRVCLWSRTANRVLMPLKVFPASNPDQLYAGVRSIHWSDHLSVQGTFSVDFSSNQSQIDHSHYGALKTKDAIVDQFRTVRGGRPSISKDRPDVRIHVYLKKDVATVSIDLSGESLHRRGYRKEGVAAPLKENLAAALILLSEWPTKQNTFLDPMCGSGTLPIEAASIAMKKAPGLGRDYYGFTGWRGHVPQMWKRLGEEARDLEIRDFSKIPPIVGYDQDYRSVRKALVHVEESGLRGRVHIEKREFSECEAIASSGTLIVNPPYGERLGETEELKALYKGLGDLFKKKLAGWDAYVFTGSRILAQAVHLKESRRFVLFNGPIECRLLKYEMYR